MVDFLYSVLTRPIANEPDKKNPYAINPAYKDGKSREISKDDPKKQHQQSSSKNEEALDSNSETKVAVESDDDFKGKGVYRDDEGRRHLDFYA